jgi:glutaminyl-peptide cyclotransferase
LRSYYTFMNYKVIAAVIIFFCTQSCKQKTTGETQTNVPTKNTPAAPVSVPAFNADSAYDYVAKQVAFGPRIPGTASQQKCSAWLEEKLKSYTPNVVIQNAKISIYNHNSVPCTNIIASFNPNAPKRILLFAHWDTRPWSDRDSSNPKKTFDGADDGGSGVAILLELARQMSKQPPTVGVDLAFFDVEDYGPPSFDKESKDNDWYALGTQYWAKNPHVPNYRAYYGILLDMVGAKNATFPLEGTSRQNAPMVLQRVWSIAQSLGYENYFLNDEAPPIIDDHNYVNSLNGTPSIDIVNLSKSTPTGFAAHWHTQSDNMKIIDKNTLKAVGQTLLQVIYTEPPTVS